MIDYDSTQEIEQTIAWHRVKLISLYQEIFIDFMVNLFCREHQAFVFQSQIAEVQSWLLSEINYQQFEDNLRQLILTHLLSFSHFSENEAANFAGRVLDCHIWSMTCWSKLKEILLSYFSWQEKLNTPPQTLICPDVKIET